MSDWCLSARGSEEYERCLKLRGEWDDDETAAPDPVDRGYESPVSRGAFCFTRIDGVVVCSDDATANPTHPPLPRVRGTPLWLRDGFMDCPVCVDMEQRNGTFPTGNCQMCGGTGGVRADPRGETSTGTSHTRT